MVELFAPQQISPKVIQLPGSKSLSNRLLILAEILNLDLTLKGLSDSEDTQLLIKALQGIKNKKEGVIDVHHAGTDMRFLTAYLSVTEGSWLLTGSERMKQRPISELVDPLRTLGAEISYTEKEFFPPLLIKGKTLRGGTLEINSSVSSQFVSALLLIAPALKNGLSLKLKGKTVSKPYIDMTISLLKHFGLTLSRSENLISVGPLTKPALHVSFPVEADWSAASYWYSICALSSARGIALKGLSLPSLQADSVLPQLFEGLGVHTTFKDATIFLDFGNPSITALKYDFNNCPDIAQTLLVCCFGLGIAADFTGLSTLKVKETDRILALKTELEKFGARLKITDDTIQMTAFKREKNKNDPFSGILRTYNDHRMAMSFAPLAFVYKSILIEDPEVVAKSYPRFWEDLKSVGFNVNLRP